MTQDKKIRTWVIYDGYEEDSIQGPSIYLDNPDGIKVIALAEVLPLIEALQGIQHVFGNNSVINEALAPFQDLMKEET